MSYGSWIGGINYSADFSLLVPCKQRRNFEINKQTTRQEIRVTRRRVSDLVGGAIQHPPVCGSIPFTRGVVPFSTFTTVLQSVTHSECGSLVLVIDQDKDDVCG